MKHLIASLAVLAMAATAAACGKSEPVTTQPACSPTTTPCPSPRDQGPPVQQP